MKKLRLQLDDLRVDSFATREAPTENVGTVAGHAPSNGRTCPGNPTCDNTCGCPSWSGPECNTVCIG
jgi:hypothetical protein